MTATATATETPAEPAPGIADETDADTVQDARTTKMMVAGGVTVLGVLGREAFQFVPSVEPIVAAAVALGFFYGARYGAVSGATGFFLSNFLVWGFHGPWTVFQVLGAGLAGGLGGMTRRFSDRPTVFYGTLLLGAVTYETVMNVGSVLYTPWAWAAPVGYMAAAVPFSAVHVVSTLSFGAILYGFRDYLEAHVARSQMAVSRYRRRTAHRFGRSALGHTGPQPGAGPEQD